MRDVFTMGARPIALLNSVHFGDPLKINNTKNALLNGVVSGIGGYGNCVGHAYCLLVKQNLIHTIYRKHSSTFAMAVGHRQKR